MTEWIRHAALAGGDLLFGWLLRLPSDLVLTLLALGSQKAWLVHGGDGTDELSIAGPSRVAALADGAITEFEVHPGQAGLPVHPFEAIIGGTPAENAAAFRALLDGTCA